MKNAIARLVHMDEGASEIRNANANNYVSHSSFAAKRQNKEHCLDFLLYEPRIWIVGPEQGSGKTGFLDWLIAQHLMMGHRVEFVNAFAPYEHYNGVKVWGKGDRYHEAAIGIAGFCLEVHRRLRLRGRQPGYDPLIHEQSYFLALDEVTEFEQFMPETLKLTEAFSHEELEHYFEGMDASEKRDRLKSWGIL